jgi:penicillin-binding protein 1A
MFRALRAVIASLLAAAVLGAALGLFALLALRAQVPDIGDVEHVRMQLPLRVLSREGAVLGEFGEQRRIPVRFEDVPDVLLQAILAAEDDRFFKHPGVDTFGLARAALAYARTGTRRQGGSTITMQVARNFFLTRDKTLRRKALEILLALELERRLDKREIFELYVNKIFLGQRAYGFAAAADVYYDKTLAELTLDEAATLAGLPKAPSRDNPVAAPGRAQARRNYVLGRMQALGWISPAQAAAARARPVQTVRERAPDIPGGLYAAEVARRWMLERVGARAYTDGYVVRTTIASSQQAAAQRALRDGLERYDRRKGWRGPEARLTAADMADARALDAQLRARGVVAGQRPAIVRGRRRDALEAYLGEGRQVPLPATALALAGKAAGTLTRGDVIRLVRAEDGWRLGQLPQIEGAVVTLAPTTGAIEALVGGYDFARSPFNRALQADRQPGSAFKPFIYAAALAAGYTPASVVNDAPIVHRADTLEGVWRPGNYTGRFYGPTRLREALAQSRNLVSVRLLEQIGVAYGQRYTLRFGFPARKVPQTLSLALGTGAMTPLELAAGYAVLANGGFRVEPYLIERVESAAGEVVFEAPRVALCEVDCTPGAQAVAPRVIPATDAYLLYSMLQEVIRSGTGAGARALGRPDLAGKTGTTNDFLDAWFAGYNAEVVTVVWTGFDQPRPLGARETGARVALPIWIDTMRSALADRPPRPLSPPPGIVTLPVDPRTGDLADAADPRAMLEVFDERHLPGGTPAMAPAGGAPSAPAVVPADLF